MIEELEPRIVPGLLGGDPTGPGGVVMEQDGDPTGTGG